MKTAIVVDYLNQYGGAERVLEAMLGVLPEADVFTSVFEPDRFPFGSPIRLAPVKAALANPFSLTGRLAKYLTGLYPRVFESFDLSGYELVISSGTIWAKGIKTRSDQLHLFYCHTPPRFLYGYLSETSRRNVGYYRPLVAVLDHVLRLWDFEAAQRPNYLAANSENVRRRIKKFYRRDSTVIYPPVELRTQNLELRTQKQGDYFLIVSRLSAYKNIDVAVQAFNELKMNLKVVGIGREEANLRKIAGPTIEFLGFVSDAALAGLYANCRAFVYTTADEDFGLTPLEANSFGKPVIAFRSGGVTETMVEGETALFFNNLSAASLTAAVGEFEGRPGDFWSAEVLRRNAARFSKRRFQEEFRLWVEAKVNGFFRTAGESR